MVNHRTVVVSQIRGLLLDRHRQEHCPGAACDSRLVGQDDELTAMARDAIAELYDLFRDLDR